MFVTRNQANYFKMTKLTPINASLIFQRQMSTMMEHIWYGQAHLEKMKFFYKTGNGHGSPRGAVLQ